MSIKVDPAAAAEIMRCAGVEPLEPYPGSRIKWKCRCLDCGETVTPRYNNVKNGQRACVQCSYQKRGLLFRNDPEEAIAVMRAADLEPEEPYPGSGIAWKCRCLTCGNTVRPSHASVQNQKSGCFYCGARERGLAQRLGEEEAVAVMRAAGLEPEEPYPGGASLWKCRCVACGHTYMPRYANIQSSASGGCPRCSKKRVAAAQTKDATQAALDMHTAGFLALETYPGSLNPWKCRCLQCGAELRPSYANVVIRGSSCRECVRLAGRPDPTTPTIIYALHHPIQNAVKVGITIVGAKESRIAGFRRRGWLVLTKSAAPTWSEALAVEQSVLRHLRKDFGLSPYLTAQEMEGMGGHTETFDADLISPSTLMSLIRFERARIEKIAPKESQ